MGKMDKTIICVSRSDLFKGDEFQGFLPAKGAPFPERLQRHRHGRRRGDVEEDASVKQLIGYAVIVHKPTASVYAFRRSTDPSRYSEKRAAGNWSWGVGGHTEATDEGGDPVANALRRELAEEVGLAGDYSMELLGFINDEQDSLGSVHFGLLYLVSVDNRDAVVTGDEFAEGGFVATSRLQELASSSVVDGWSKIVLTPLIQRLSPKSI
jgi:predicted NUDIX family phosphoesterase